MSRVFSIEFQIKFTEAHGPVFRMNNFSGLDYFPDCEGILTLFWKHVLFKYQLPISTRLTFLLFPPLDIH